MYLQIYSGNKWSQEELMDSYRSGTINLKSGLLNLLVIKVKSTMFSSLQIHLKLSHVETIGRLEFGKTLCIFVIIQQWKA
jgi:hypothetical protein